jgi:hypothetical protein
LPIRAVVGIRRNAATFGPRALGLAFAVTLLLALSPGNALASTPCGTGSWSFDGNEPCAPADQGYYVAGTGATSETACDAGTYDPIGDSASVADCLLDTPGTYSLAGAAIATPCAPGTYGDTTGLAACTQADAGYFVAVSEAIAEVPCPGGYYSSTPGSTACQTSPAGDYAPAASTSPIPCVAGTYAPAASALCLDDPPGSYSANTAAAASPCAPGSYAANTDTLACTPADPGSFVNVSGAIAEQPCPAGSYSAAAASIACTLAPAGSYAAQGATAATVCAEGTQTTRAGEAACTPDPTLAGGGGQSGSGQSGGGQSGGGQSNAPSLSVQKVVKLGHGGIRLLLRSSATGAFGATAQAASRGYGTVVVSGSGAAATITVKPTKAAAKLLAHSPSLRISVVVTFTSKTGGAPVTRTVVVTLHGSKHA